MFEIEFLPQAIQDLERLDKPVSRRILRRLQWVAEKFDLLKPEPLSGPLAGLFKLRVGDYRVIYERNVGLKKLTIHLVGHRSAIYDRG